MGAKGEGRFEPVEWETAVAVIASRFAEIIRTDGPAALLPFDFAGSMGVVQRRALRRLFHALGASRQSGSVCARSGSLLGAEGTPIGFDPEELVDARLIVLWGSNLLTTAPHTFRFMLEARRRHGARLIAIDPRATLTTARCDRHLAVRPGTDHILALAAGHVLLEEGLADLEFASQAALDLDEYRREAANWTPVRAAEVCGVPAAEIVSFAHEIGRARPAAIRSGIAPQQTVAGEEFVRALSALAVLGGHWRHPGGGLFVMTSPVLNEEAAAVPSLGPVPRRLDMARLGEHLTSTTLSPPVRGLMVWCANPAVTQPDAGRVRDGLTRDDLFLVVAEHFLTDTARYADLVLPATTQLEHFDVQGAWGHQYVSVNLPAIPPLGEAKSHGEMMRLLAAGLGLDHPALRESDEAIAASALPEWITLDELKARGYMKSPRARPVFGGAGVRVRLHQPASLPDDRGRLRLLTPKAHHFLNSTFANLPVAQRAERHPTLHMHPADAGARRLQAETTVRVHNDRGSVTAVLHVSADIRAGSVALPGKWWADKAASNLLTPSLHSPGGQPAYHDVFVEVSPR